MKDGYSLVVTSSSIPSSATRGPNVDLSSKGSEDALEDPDDEPTIKRRISESDEEKSVDFKTEFMGMCLFLLFSFFLVISSSYIYLFHPFVAIFPLLSIFILLIAKTFKEPEVAADTWMPITTPPTTSTAPIFAIPVALAFAILVSATFTASASAIPIFATLTTPILMSPSEFSHLLPHFFLVSSLLLDHGFSY